MSPVLKLSNDDEKLERVFELEYLLSLTTKERFQMMMQKSDEIKRTLVRHGYRKPVEIIKREQSAGGKERGWKSLKRK